MPKRRPGFQAHNMCSIEQTKLNAHFLKSGIVFHHNKVLNITGVLIHAAKEITTSPGEQYSESRRAVFTVELRGGDKNLD